MDGFFTFIENLIKAPFICFGWLIVGFLAGGIARYLTRSRDMPFWNDMLLGWAGAIIGGFITSGLLGFDPDTFGLNLLLINLVIAIIAAAGLILIGRQLFGTKPVRKKRKKRR
jgi:uncharacterized membrane protein YeaQ/YmgE (transglycosylase-associated protein family)